jgi:SRSO17 transposase
VSGRGSAKHVLRPGPHSLVNGANAVRVIDDAGAPRPGLAVERRTPEYCGELGKQSNCQWLVSLTLALHEVPVPVGVRLLLPKEWTDDLPRCTAAGVFGTVGEARTKPQIGLGEIVRVIAAGTRPSWTQGTQFAYP